ncbi:hypothetical protein [Enterobacter sp. ENT03]|uniref:hypothetical protein n=1 Tax=Enterobacter sp. ENT03 TaxID=2854780 RepID=UPI001C45520B|nr:hypothetical protein [Enterobacter sp. ENT03]MBV7406543.1 hypothetical protein [Enterobacter sp. ENT03]
MNNPIQWDPPFNDHFGNGMVYRPFSASNKIFAVGFEEIQTMHDLMRKGISILAVNPAFRFPETGVRGVIFDEIDLHTLDFNAFRHIVHPGVAGGRVLFNVASIILEHYSISNAGAYVFSAASDPTGLRKTDLVDLYSRALGVDGCPGSKLFRDLFPGWQAYSDVATGGRGYVVTTERY